LAFLGASGLSTAGTAVGLLAATGASTAAASNGNGALATGLYMAIVMLTSALSVPYAPSVGRRLGARHGYVLLQGASAFTWAMAGVALLLGAPVLPTLFIAAPIFGVTGGLSTVMRPMLTRAYLSGAGTADAFARLSVVNGVGWGVGALGGGLLLSVVPLGWGLVLNGLTVIPLVVIVSRVSPTAEPSTPRAADRPWRDARASLAGSRPLRLTAALGASSLFFFGPLTSLVVPIAQDLRQSPLVAGAGFLMTAFAVGEFLSPRVVRVLSGRRDDLSAGALAGVGAGVSLVVLGVTSLVLSDRVELAAWLVIGVAFGALRYAARAFFVGSAAEAGPPEDASHNLAAAMLVSGLAGPFGTMAWSAVIGGVSADAAVLAAGIGAVVAGALVGRAARGGADPRAVQSGTASPTPI
jgi:MFS family permease